MTDTRPRLMQVTHDLAIGGLQRVVTTLCRTLDRRSFDVRVLCLRALGPFQGDIEACGIPVTLLPQTKRTDYASFLRVARILRAQRIDVIHTHNTQPFIDGTLGALLAGVPTIVHTDHARSFPDKRRYMLAERVMSRFAYRVVGVSNHTSSNLRKYEGIDARKIVTIPNGIESAAFDIPADLVSERRRLGIDPDGPVIGLGVRLTSQKGITYLLRALPGLLPRFPNLALLIAGDGPLAPELKAEADTLGVSAHVRFLGPRTDVALLLKIFDLYVLPSVWEGLPMVVLEAMAAGCPVVATDVGGVATAIRSGSNGLLVPPRDPVALSNSIAQLLDDNELRSRLASQARQDFQQRFTAEVMTRQYERLYLRQA